ncbi:MAG: FHA domain-containing protein [Myxococcota bacterium]
MIESVEVIIRQPGFPDRVIPLREGRTRLGRADDNEIVLSDVGVSRRHAQIVVERGEVSVEDLGSGNGTYYFGHRIKAQPIRDHDEVVIDPFILQFRVVGDVGYGQGPDTVAQDTLENGVRLEVVVGNGVAGHLYPILERGITMGRAEDRDVVVPDSASSRHHCHITVTDGEYVLHDNGSANGVFVNAVRVRECTLSDGDLLRIGNTELRFVNPYAQQESQPAPVHQEPPAAWNETEVPSEPAVPDEPSLSASVEPRRASRVSYDEPPARAGGGGGVVLGAVLTMLVVGIVGVVGVIMVIAGVLWFTAPTVATPKIPPRPPSWTLQLPPDLPPSNTEQLFNEGSTAAQSNDYELALQDFYRVLTAEPGHRSAKKFAAFTAEVMVAQTLGRELTLAEEARLKREARRDRLLRESENSRNNRVRRNAERELQQDFREDPLVQKKMNWSLTDRQLGHREIAARIEQRTKVDQHDEAVRLARKLLQESTEPELRDKVEALLAEAEAKQSKAVASVWRKAVMDEALGDTAAAIEGYKAIIKQSPNNISARIRIERLEKP